MKSEITKLLHMTKFFKIIQSNENIIKYTLEEPSRILKQNIQISWLRSILTKTQKSMPVYLKKVVETQRDIPYGYIERGPEKKYEDIIFEHKLDEEVVQSSSELKLSLVLPENDVMQYFIQWQRYRKYWWSSITTTPSLFKVDDIKYNEKGAEVKIVGHFPGGPFTAETVSIATSGDSDTRQGPVSVLSCSLCRHQALLVLLLDGLASRSRDYLRLHRTMAPYKMCYALEEAPSKDTLKELATLLHLRLAADNISTKLPDFSVPMDSQIKENFELGIPYTAILSEKTLKDGIFHLKSSSTTLNEMVHIAGFLSYAALICKK